jgi:putative membrane protein
VIVVMYYGDHMSGWGWAFMVLGTVLFWAVLIAGIVLLLRRGGRGNRWGNNPPSPEELLAQRFARGEIDEGEYRQRVAVLAERPQTHSRSQDEWR